MDMLKELNDGYVRAYEEGDIEFYKRVLAPDFMSSEPDFQLRDKERFLEFLSKPRPITDMKAHEVVIRIIDDFAIVHARLTFKNLNSVECEGRYTDDYHRRDGIWVCVAGTVIADRQ
jgi:hypothetical protein